MSKKLFSFAEAELRKMEITKRTQKEIAGIYKDMLSQVEKKLNIIGNKTATDALRTQQLKALQEELVRAQKVARQRISEGTKKAVKEAGDAVYQDNLRDLTKYGVKGSIAQVPDDVITRLLTGKVYAGDWTYSKAIWGASEKVTKDINTIVAQGIALNKPTLDIAKDLEKYVDPSAAKPWDWRKVYPGVSTKVDYNAQRLARTLIQHSYQLSLRAVIKDNPFIEQVRWRSVLQEKRTCDICRERHNKVYTKGKEPLDHPNGLCTILPIVDKSTQEVAKEIGDFLEGKGDNPKLDKYFKNLGVKKLVTKRVTTKPKLKRNIKSPKLSPMEEFIYEFDEDKFLEGMGMGIGYDVKQLLNMSKAVPDVMIKEIKRTNPQLFLSIPSPESISGDDLLYYLKSYFSNKVGTRKINPIFLKPAKIKKLKKKVVYKPVKPKARISMKVTKGSDRVQELWGKNLDELLEDWGTGWSNFSMGRIRKRAEKIDPKLTKVLGQEGKTRKGDVMKIIKAHYSWTDVQFANRFKVENKITRLKDLLPKKFKKVKGTYKKPKTTMIVDWKRATGYGSYEDFMGIKSDWDIRSIITEHWTKEEEKFFMDLFKVKGRFDLKTSEITKDRLEKLFKHLGVVKSNRLNKPPYQVKRTLPNIKSKTVNNLINSKKWRSEKLRFINSDELSLQFDSSTIEALYKYLDDNLTNEQWLLLSKCEVNGIVSKLGGAHYKPLTREVHMDLSKMVFGNQDETARTLFHELGHALDFNLSDISSSDNFGKEFDRLIKKGYERMLNSNGRLITHIRSELQKDPFSSGLQDAISGLSLNNNRVSWGHSTEYWTRIPDPDMWWKEVTSETMANMNAAFFVEKERRSMLKYFPEAYRYYIDRVINPMIREAKEDMIKRAKRERAKRAKRETAKRAKD